MSGKPSNIAFSVAVGVGSPIELNSAGQPPDWIMLMPAGVGGTIATVDGRGPYHVINAAALVARSLQAAGGRFPIDENHATDLAAKDGRPAPARGWVTHAEARQDGIYGRVEWNPTGTALMQDKAYRFISPVFTHDAAGNVTGLLRASLTNTPNLRGMAALHQAENTMDLLAQLRKLLGLPDDATEAAIIEKITAMTAQPDATATAAAMAPIATALGLAAGSDATAIASAVAALKNSTSLATIAKAAGLKEDADVTAIASAVTTLAAGSSSATQQIVALQSDLRDLADKLNAATATTAKDKATAYVDGEIAKGRVGVKSLRDHYIAMHAADPARVEMEIGGLPIVGPGNLLTTEPVNKDGKVALNAAHENAARILGIPLDKYRKTLESEQAAS